MKNNWSGFVLMEVLPALLVLMGAFILSGRMLAHAVETRVRTQQIVLAEGILETVWKEWELRGGSAALVSKDADAGWVISTFPDESWLPMGSGDPVSESILFRRRRMESQPAWQMDRLLGSDWHYLTTILVPAAEENTE